MAHATSHFTLRDILTFEDNKNHKKTYDVRNPDFMVDITTNERSTYADGWTSETTTYRFNIKKFRIHYNLKDSLGNKSIYLNLIDKYNNEVINISWHSSNEYYSAHSNISFCLNFDEKEETKGRCLEKICRLNFVVDRKLNLIVTRNTNKFEEKCNLKRVNHIELLNTYERVIQLIIGEIWAINNKWVNTSVIDVETLRSIVPKERESFPPLSRLDEANKYYIKYLKYKKKYLNLKEKLNI